MKTFSIVYYIHIFLMKLQAETISVTLLEVPGEGTSIPCIVNIYSAYINSRLISIFLVITPIHLT